MNDYATLPASTRVWIYHSNRPFDDQELPMVKVKLQQFARQWVSHNRQLRAHGDILHNRFVVLMVDESQSGASGCSIDSSVNFLKSLQAEHNVDLFDRMIFSYLDGEQVKSVSRDEFSALYEAGKITDDTPVFDTLVNNKGDFEQQWIKPLSQSWHKRMV